MYIISFKYNDKEFDTQLGLNQYDYGFRGFDPAFVRFTTPDPLAEKFPFQSPYVYAANNPVKFIDYKGLAAMTRVQQERQSLLWCSAIAGLDDWEPEKYPFEEAPKTAKEKMDEEEEEAESEEKTDPKKKSEEEIKKELEEYVAKGVANAIDFLRGSFLEFVANNPTQPYSPPPLPNPALQNIYPEAFIVTFKDMAVKAISTKVAEKVALKSLKPLGLGSTGRTVAANLTEQLAMKEAMANPSAGQIITNMKPLTDPRWSGWRKMQYEHVAFDGTKTIIHYNGKWVDGVLKAVDDFKFK